jgi:hypothetical protein
LRFFPKVTCFVSFCELAPIRTNVACCQLRAHTSDRQTQSVTQPQQLRAVYTLVFCVRCPVCDGAAAQQLPLLCHVRDRARKAKGAVGRRRHRGRDNGRKKHECRRPLKDTFFQALSSEMDRNEWKEWRLSGLE